MGRDVSSVTVYGNGHQVDLTLPNTAPLVDLTPAVAELCGCEAGDATPATWALARVGQAPLPLSATLAASGVLDGESLYLVDTSAWDLPRVVRIEDAVVAGVETGVSWLEGPHTSLVAAAGVAFLAGGAFVALAVGSLAGPDAPALLACAVALLAAAHVLAGLSRPMEVAVCAAAWILAGAAGAGFAGAALEPRSFVGAAVAVAVAVAASSSIVPTAVPVAGVMCATIGIAGAAVGAGMSPVRVGVIAAVGAALTLRIVPSLLSSNLSRRSLSTDLHEMIDLSRRARHLLISMVVGCVAVVVTASVVLLMDGSPWTVGLALVMASSLAVRAIDFVYLSEALAPAVGAAVIVLGAEVLAGLRLLPAHGRPELGPVLLVLSGVVVLVVAAMTPTPGPERGHSGRFAWTAIDAATVPLVLGSLGLLQSLSHATQRLFG